MTTRGEINSNFYQIVNVDGNGSPTSIKGNYIISGNVDNADHANVADVANSVSVSNVAGIGNIATINLSGNGTQTLLGNGTWGALPNTANANYANFAGTAFNVSGSNVTGSVANATYSNISGVSYSVSGSNVTGTVGNATHSNVSDVANSVAVANVTGIGNIATINLDGNVSNILHGDGSWAPESESGNANYASYAGNVTISAQPNITSVGNLINLTIANSSNSTGIVSIFDPNGTTVSNVSGARKGYDVKKWYWPNASTSSPSLDTVIRHRGNSTTPTTIVQNDRVSQRNYYGYNGVDNVLAGSEVWTATGAISSNVGDVFTGGQYTLVSFNPTGNIANASSLAAQNQMVLTNSGSFQITPGGPANTAAGQAMSSWLVTSYGNITNPEFAGGLNFQKARGNRDANLSVQPGDQVARSVFIPHNGSTFQSTSPSQYRVIVDSSYVANDAIVPMYHQFQTVANVAGSASFKNFTFYANGVAVFPDVNTGNVVANTLFGDGGNISNIQVANVSGLGNIATINLDGSSSNVLYGNGVWATISIPGGDEISNGTTSVSIPAADGNIVFTTNGVEAGAFDTNQALNLTQSVIKNGSNTQQFIFGLDNANGGVEPQIVFRASAGNLTNPEPLTTPYNSMLMSLVGSSYNGSDYGFGGMYGVRYVGEPTTPSWFVYGEPTIRYVQETGNSIYYFENKSGGSTYLGGFDIDNSFAPYVYDYSFNLDQGNGNFSTFTFGANTGNLTIPGIYNGDGGGLSNIAVANVVGLGNIATINLDGSTSNVLYGNGVFAAIPTISNVANANYANFAGTAYNVSGSNVSGEVANANYATFSGTAYSVSGANVVGSVANSNYAAYSGTSFSVDGPNVVGVVGNASHATISDSANSVAVANVTGIGNIATVNLTGSTSNVLYGNGVFAAIPTISNVANANYANYAGEAFSVSAANIVGTVNLANYATVANSVAGSNVSGEVANANFATNSGLATFATTANSVSVANVSGIGNIATTNYDGNGSHVLYGNGVWANIPTVTSVANANYSNFAGEAFSVSASNIVGTVNLANYATVANSVAGANVTGQVGFAAVANNVAVANVSGIGNIATINLDGNSSNYLAGNGVFGPVTVSSVANANYANFAGTAFSVSGSNVVGAVANATFADVANTVAIIQDAANTSNQQVYFGGTGNSRIKYDTSFAYNSDANILYALNFSGNGSRLTSLTGANVSGEVSFAAVANSVSVANVSGIGNIATINLDGSTSNVLYGNGVWAGVSATNANFANYAGNITVSAQPNITSVGTLTTLTVSGNLVPTNIVLDAFNETLPASANTSTSITPDVSTGTIFRYTANANFTFNSLTNAVAGSSATVFITQDGTGNRTLTSTMKFAGASKTLSTTAGAIDIIGVIYDGTTYFASLTKGYA